MDWIKQHYDRLLLVLLGLALLALASLAAYQAMSFPEVFSERNSPKPKDNTIKPLPIESLHEGSEQLGNPRLWNGNKGSLFVSTPYIVRDGELISPEESKEKLHPPVENKWLIDNRLDYTMADVLETDADGDGFTNLDEYEGGSDPTDPKSHPPYTTKLRVAKFEKIPFRLKFNGTPDEGKSFSINAIDAGQRTQILSLGDKIKGTPFVIKSYEKKSAQVKGVDKDVSELLIENTETGEQVTLINNTVVDSPASFAIFVFLIDGKEKRVKKNDIFTFPFEESTTVPENEHKKYKLVDISQSEAVIQDLQSQDKIPIKSMAQPSSH